MDKNTKQIKSKRYKISNQRINAVNEGKVAVSNVKSTIQNTGQNEPKKDKKQKKKSKSGFLSKIFKKIFNVKDNISKVTSKCKTAVSRTKKVGGWIKKACQAKPNTIGTMQVDKHLSTKDKIRKIIKEINEF